MLKKTVLREKKDFSNIYSKGKSLGSRYVVLFFIKNKLGYNRICVLASKKVGNSVKRNRARRLIKSAFSAFENRIEQGYDIIFIARKEIVDSKCIEVEKSIYGILKRSNLFIKEQEKKDKKVIL